MQGGEPWTVDRFFEGDGTARNIYEAAERMASGIGPMTVRVSKSQVSFRRREHNLRAAICSWPGMPVNKERDHQAHRHDPEQQRSQPKYAPTHMNMRSIR